jgi:hypothetical protein
MKLKSVSKIKFWWKCRMLSSIKLKMFPSKFLRKMKWRLMSYCSTSRFKTRIISRICRILGRPWTRLSSCLMSETTRKLRRRILSPSIQICLIMKLLTISTLNLWCSNRVDLRILISKESMLCSCKHLSSCFSVIIQSSKPHSGSSKVIPRIATQRSDTLKKFKSWWTQWISFSHQNLLEVSHQTGASKLWDCNSKILKSNLLKFCISTKRVSKNSRLLSSTLSCR